MTDSNVTPLHPTKAERITTKVKQALTDTSKSPNVKWTVNTVRGVIIAGVAQMAAQNVAQGMSRRVPKA
jgi:hypothetical protein